MPYTPIFNHTGFISCDEIGIPIKGYLYCFPSVANYLGGDIVSGVLFTEIYKTKRTFSIYRYRDKLES